MENTIKKLNRHIVKNNLCDFFISDLKCDHLVISACLDLSYPAKGDVDIIFKTIKYISLPAYFNDASFRLGADEDISSINKKKQYNICSEEKSLIFIDEDMGEGVRTYFVIAKEIEYVVKG